MADNVNPLPVPESLEPKKRRKHVHGSTLLPNRPKRALTAYSMFLKDFFHQRGETAEGMREAGAQWKILDADRKVQFKNLCADDKVRHGHEMKLWKGQKNFLKRPASSYALYLKDLWTRERNSGRTIGEMGKFASERWKTMTQEHKSVYQERYDTLLAQHKENMVQLIIGNVIVTNEGVVQIAQTPNGVNNVYPSVADTEEDDLADVNVNE